MTTRTPTKAGRQAPPPTNTHVAVPRRRVPLKLSELQMATFVDVYRKTFSATKAARACGYSERNAPSTGSRLLGDARVQELLERQTLETLAASNISTGDILMALAEIAYLDPAECFERVRKGRAIYVRLLDLDAMPKHVRRAIASFKVTKQNLTAGDGETEDVVEVKFWNKVNSLELLGKHRALFKEVVEHQITIRQLETMSDEELMAKDKEVTERYEKAVAARAQLRLQAQQAIEAVKGKKK